MIEIKNEPKKKFECFRGYLKSVVLPSLWSMFLLMFLMLLVFDGTIIGIIRLIVTSTNEALSFIKDEFVRGLVFVGICLLGAYSFYKYIGLKDTNNETKSKESGGKEK